MTPSPPANSSSAKLRQEALALLHQVQFTCGEDAYVEGENVSILASAQWCESGHDAANRIHAQITFLSTLSCDWSDMPVELNPSALLTVWDITQPRALADKVLQDPRLIFHSETSLELADPTLPEFEIQAILARELNRLLGRSSDTSREDLESTYPEIHKRCVGSGLYLDFSNRAGIVTFQNLPLGIYTANNLFRDIDQVSVHDILQPALKAKGLHKSESGQSPDNRLIWTMTHLDDGKEEIEVAFETESPELQDRKIAFALVDPETRFAPDHLTHTLTFKPTSTRNKWEGVKIIQLPTSLKGPLQLMYALCPGSTAHE